jgi:hypothetical protein
MQKLPTVQKDGVFAPTDVKIDGDAKEWNNKFQAYNKTTHIFYTLANDNNNLYFIVQATDVHDVQKAITGGITLTIKGINKDNSDSPVSITYPRMYSKDTQPVVTQLKDDQTNMNEDLPAINKQLTDNAKFVQITGIKEITDTLTSIYNEQGIKTAGLIDLKKAYTYELAIPLKYLQPFIGKQATFAYDIKLNGRLNALKPKQTAPARVLNITNVRISGQAMSPAILAEAQDLNEPTDFTGNYTIAKK